jgi:uncharacterized protein (TIGR00290 family)
MIFQHNSIAIFNWSSGKDSALALYKIRQQREFDIKCLLTSVNQQYGRVSMHGVRVELLEKQAENIGLPLYKVLLPEMPSMEDYNRIFEEVMENFKNQGVAYSIYGDIFLEDLKRYREKQLEKVNMQAVFPLWKKPTRELLDEYIKAGFKAIVVCVNEKYLDQSFVGRIIDQNFLNDLPANVDPCGENGEYHSFVFDGPIFKKPIDFTVGEVVYKKYPQPQEDSKAIHSKQDAGFYYCDLLLK